MDVPLLFQVAGVGIVVALMATVLKQAGKDDQGQLLSLVGVLVVMTLVARLLGEFFNYVAFTFKWR